MAVSIAHHITKLRKKMAMNQTEFGKLFDTTAMSVSRWEKDVHPPDARSLFKLGILAKGFRMDGWVFWAKAGITRAEVRSALAPRTRAAAASRA